MSNWIQYTVGIIVLLMAFTIFYGLSADAERHGKHHEYRGESHEDGVEKHKHSRRDLNPVDNQTYKETCGACHLAYQPGLLPSGSWLKVISDPKNHFGETLEIDSTSMGLVRKYLNENAAEKSQWKRSHKILRSLNGETPLRISEVPYIVHKHQDIPPEVLTRNKVRSLSNCSACHRAAAQGIYEDDDAVIPK